MQKALTFIMIMFFCAGCMTQNVNIQTTKQWENHYMSVSEFKTATQDIVLDKNESIWVLSNTTLKRLIKELKENNK